MPQSTAACMRHPWRSGLLAAGLWAGAAATAWAAPVDDLRSMIESGRSAEAYVTYGAGSDVATRPEAFDRWCGAAAVDLGRAGEGVLALERYVLRFPDDAALNANLWQWLLWGVGDEPGVETKVHDKSMVKKAAKCEMCKDLPHGPAYVSACPTGAARRVSPERFLDYTNPVEA